MSVAPDGEELASWVRDARRRTLEIIADLTDEQLSVPLLEIVNPLLWEIGHIAWFQEHWVLRHAGGEPPLLETADALYDSSAVAHGTRWNLPLPDRTETVRYVTTVRDRILARIERGALEEEELYFHLLSVFHEDMHGEAFLYMRQTLGYPAPALTGCSTTTEVDDPGEDDDGDAYVPGGTLLLGSPPGAPFVFDNEQWAHPVEIDPFAIAKRATTEEQFLSFVEDGGYRRQDLWSDEGWAWREAERAEHPLYFSKGSDGRFMRRHFHRLVPLEPRRPITHVNGYEADAYCRWAGRRLPTEAEWEAAAACEPDGKGDLLASGKRRYPWGDRPPTPTRANLDARALDTVSVDALPHGDSAFGCRQMVGNVWEWTASPFTPYPGFAPGPYEEYSAPWFGSRRVLRGGSWATRSRMIDNAYRNYFPPERRDLFAGFRTCASSRSGDSK